MRKKLFLLTIRLSLFLLMIFGVTGCEGLKSIPVATNPSVSKSIKTADPTQSNTPTLESTSTLSIEVVSKSSFVDPNAISLADECRTVMDDLNTLKGDLGLPDHFTTKNPSRQATDFDPNSYFQVFKHLSIKPGYTLDFVYFADDWGGKPLVYARKITDAPFTNYEEFLGSYNEGLTGEQSYAQLNHAFDYLEQIQVDKTPESYYEFIVLAFLGDQFYLQWHGMYRDQKIICDINDMQYVYAELDSFELEFPQDTKNNIERIDFDSRLLINGDTVSVRIVAFSKWGGFWENIYVMDKENPWNVIDIQSSSLLEYECGIMF